MTREWISTHKEILLQFKCIQYVEHIQYPYRSPFTVIHENGAVHLCYPRYPHTLINDKKTAPKGAASFTRWFSENWGFSDNGKRKLSIIIFYSIAAIYSSLRAVFSAHTNIQSFLLFIKSFGEKNNSYLHPSRLRSPSQRGLKFLQLAGNHQGGGGDDGSAGPFAPSSTMRILPVSALKNVRRNGYCHNHDRDGTRGRYPEVPSKWKGIRNRGFQRGIKVIPGLR